MELKAVIAAFVIGNGGKGIAFGSGDGAESDRQLRDLLTLCHPDLVAFSGLPKLVKKSAAVAHFQKGATGLLMARCLQPPAQLSCHDLMAVANAENRNVLLKDRLRNSRRMLLEHLRAAA